MIGARAATALLLACGSALGGCELVGGMAQNWEYAKLIEVHPAYTGLENQTVAVLVEVDLAALYEYPDVALTIAAYVSRHIRTNVPGVSVLDARAVADWQFRTHQWNVLPYGEIAEQLNVDRVVHIDVYEYRLHPRGNQWLWEGVCAASVGVIERDGLDPDDYVETFNVESRFPDLKGVARDRATRNSVQRGLLTLFVERTAWLFYKHLEPKYPDQYRAQR